MSIEERMSVDERRKYLHKMRFRYWQAESKKEKGRLLDEMEAVTKLHRKSLVRLINGELAQKVRKKQRGRTYGVEVKDAIRVIAQSLDYPCAEWLSPNLVWMAKHLAKHQEMSISPGLLAKLGKISVSTVRRQARNGSSGSSQEAAWTVTCYPPGNSHDPYFVGRTPGRPF